MQQKLSYLQQQYGDLSWNMSAGVSAVAKFSMKAMNWRTWLMVVVFFTWILLFSCTEAIVAREDGNLEVGSDDQPKKDMKYYQIWASQDGETHFTKCEMHGFSLSVYASLPQYLRSDFGGEPLKIVFTELPVGMVQPLHSPPEVQFVVTLSGSWYMQIFTHF